MSPEICSSGDLSFANSLVLSVSKGAVLSLTSLDSGNATMSSVQPGRGPLKATMRPRGIQQTHTPPVKSSTSVASNTGSTSSSARRSSVSHPSDRRWALTLRIAPLKSNVLICNL